MTAAKKRNVLKDMSQKAQAAATALLPGAFPLTDMGNCERLVARYRDRVRYCPPRRKWLTWDGRRWAWDQTGQVMLLAKRTARAIYAEAEACGDDNARAAIAKHARASEKRGSLEAMIALAQSEERIPVLPQELDADPWLLCCENGTIDLHTGALREHQQADLCTKMAAAEYHPGATSELWIKFLVDATGGDADLSLYLQRLAGYSLYGAVTEKSFWFLYGPPDGMKSTFIGALAGTLGDYAHGASFETWLKQTFTGGNRDDIVALLGRRLVASVEVCKGLTFDESLIKKVTGNDAFSYAAKFEAPITFRATFTLILAANDAPTIRDDDDGMWSRVKRIPFTNPLPKDQQDPLMSAKLGAPDVRSAILAWAVAGCAMWREHGVGTCAAVEKSNTEYREDMDRVSAFFSERCAFGAAETVARKDLVEAYESWCRDERIQRPASPKDLAGRLRSHGCTEHKVRGTRYWCGVRLLGDWEEADDSGGQGAAGGSNSQEEPSRERNLQTSGELVPPGAPSAPPDGYDDEERLAIQGELRGME